MDTLSAKQDEIKLSLYKDAKLDPSGIAPLLETFKGDLSFRGAGKPGFIYRFNKEGKLLLLRSRVIRRQSTAPICTGVSALKCGPESGSLFPRAIP